MYKFLCISGLLLWGINTLAQQKQLSDTTVLLPEYKAVGIIGRAKNTGFQVQKIDSNYIKQNTSADLADALENETQVQIKTYGNSMLASSTYRGLAARHTGVFWNGVNINQAGLGMIDLNLVPVIAANNISVWQGGSAALLGTGNMAGSIHLDDVPGFNKTKKFSYNQSFGSFSLHSETGMLQLSDKKIYSQTTFQYKAAKNDYTFQNPSIDDNALQREKNAAFHKTNFVQNFSFNLRKYGLLSIHYWYENANREIPPTLFEAGSDAVQKDISHKGVASWGKQIKQVQLKITTADLWDALNYTDTLSRVSSNYQLNTLVFKANVKYNFNSHFKYYFNAAKKHYTMHNNNYVDSILNSNLWEANTGIKAVFFKNKLSVDANVAYAKDDKKYSPVTPSVGAKYKLFHFFTLRANADYNYTFPTLNDLYWQPGGNINLLPEQGWAYEAGADLQIRKSKSFLSKTYFTWFSQNINNWIAWVPSAKNYWVPINYKNVWSRGVEVGLNVLCKRKKSYIKLNVNYSYTLATNESVVNKSDYSLHRQLIYVPYYKGNTTLTYAWRNFRLRLNAIYNGAEFATSDNTTLLPTYWLFNAGVYYTFHLKKIKMMAGCKVNNITNTNYQPLLGYAMPGRNFEGSVKISFQ